MTRDASAPLPTLDARRPAGTSIATLPLIARLAAATRPRAISYASCGFKERLAQGESGNGRPGSRTAAVKLRILKPAFRIPAATPGMLGVMRVFTIKRGATPTTGRPRRRVRLAPRTVRGRATAVVTLMTTLALTLSAGILLYVVRHELVGTALIEANDSTATTAARPETQSGPTTGPPPSASPVADPQITQVPVGHAHELDFTLIDTAQDTMVRLMLIGIPLLLLLVDPDQHQPDHG